jgi:hypothetical protein
MAMISRLMLVDNDSETAFELLLTIFYIISVFCKGDRWLPKNKAAAKPRPHPC